MSDQVIRREISGDGEDAFDVGDNPKGVVIFGEEVWTANTDDGTVTTLSLDGLPTSSEPIDVGGEPRGVVSGFDKVWVSNGEATSRRLIRPMTTRSRRCGSEAPRRGSPRDRS